MAAEQAVEQDQDEDRDPDDDEVARRTVGILAARSPGVIGGVRGRVDLGSARPGRGRRGRSCGGCSGGRRRSRLFLGFGLVGFSPSASESSSSSSARRLVVAVGLRLRLGLGRPAPVRVRARALGAGSGSRLGLGLAARLAAPARAPARPRAPARVAARAPARSRAPSGSVGLVGLGGRPPPASPSGRSVIAVGSLLAAARSLGRGAGASVPKAPSRRVPSAASRVAHRRDEQPGQPGDHVISPKTAMTGAGADDWPRTAAERASRSSSTRTPGRTGSPTTRPIISGGVRSWNRVWLGMTKTMFATPCPKPARSRPRRLPDSANRNTKTPNRPRSPR